MTIERIYKITNGTIPNCKASHMSVGIHYDLGGFNMFTNQEKERGYYLSIHPINRSIVGGIEMESVQAFTGKSNCIVSCTRQSKKKLAEAMETLNKIGLTTLHEWFPNIEISEEYEERKR